MVAVAVEMHRVGESSWDRRTLERGDGDVIEIGRSASNDLVISDIAIGRNHLRLRVGAEGLRCEWVHPQTPVVRQNGNRVSGGEIIAWDERLQLDRAEIRFSLAKTECVCEDYRRHDRVPYGEPAFAVREASGLRSSVEVLEVVCLRCESRQHVDIDHGAHPPTVRWGTAW